MVKHGNTHRFCPEKNFANQFSTMPKPVLTDGYYETYVPRKYFNCTVALRALSIIAPSQAWMTIASVGSGLACLVGKNHPTEKLSK